MYNNFSSKKTKKVISALLASALVVTSAPISAEAATTKVLGVNKTFTKTATKVSGLSKSEKKIVKVTVNKSKKKVTVKGLKPGKASFKIGSKSYTVKVGAVAIKKKSFATSLKVGTNKKVTVTSSYGAKDTLKWSSSKTSVVKVSKATTTASAKKVGTNTLKPVKAGTATITVKSKNTGKSLKVKVTVKAAETATATPATTPTTVPTATGSATTTPSVAPTATATATATGSATTAPSVDPSAVPTATGSATTAPTATGSATTAPTTVPTVDPSATPTTAPTQTPEVVSASVVSVGAVNTQDQVLSLDAVTKNGSIEVTFSETVKESSINNTNFTITDANGKNISIPASDVKLAIGGKKAVVSIKNLGLDKKATYTLTVKNVETAKGDKVVDYKTTFTVANVAIINNLKLSATDADDELSTNMNAGTEYLVATATEKNNASITKYTRALDGNNYLYTAVTQGVVEANPSGEYYYDANASWAGKQITVKFDELLDSTTVNAANIELTNTTTGERVPVTFTTATTNGTVTIRTNVALTAKNLYKITIKGVKTAVNGAAEELTHTFTVNGVAPLSDKEILTYKTLDGNAVENQTNIWPKLTAGNKELNATDTKYYAGIQINVAAAESLDAESVKNCVFLVEKETKEIVETTVSYNEEAKMIVIVPKADLKEDTDYEIQYLGGLRTTDYVYLNANKKNDVYTQETVGFKTMDVTSPEVVSIESKSGTNGLEVTKAQEFVVTFSEGVSLIPANVLLTETSVDVETLTVIGLTTEVSEVAGSNGKQWTVKVPANSLTADKAYKLRVLGKDSKNWATKGKLVTDTYTMPNFLKKTATYTFSTENDTNAPKLVNVYEGTDITDASKVLTSTKTNVKANDKFTFVFDEKIQLTSASAKIEALQNGTWTGVANAQASSAETTNKDGENVAVTVTIPADFKMDAKCRIVFEKGQIIDQANGDQTKCNEFDLYRYEFVATDSDDDVTNVNMYTGKDANGTGAVAPDTEGNVAVDGRFFIVLDEKDITGLTAANVSVTDADGNAVAGEVKEVTDAVSDAKFTGKAVYAFIPTANLAYAANYTVTLSGVTDIVGNKIATKAVTFKTVKEAHKVTAVSIEDGAVSVNRKATITIDYNNKEATDDATVTLTKSGNPSTVLTEGTAYTIKANDDKNKHTITFVGDAQELEANTTYVLEITFSGNSNKKTVTFTTGLDSKDVVKPELATIDVDGRTITKDKKNTLKIADGTITLTFNEKLNKDDVKVEIVNAADTSKVASILDKSLSSDGKVLTITTAGMDTTTTGTTYKVVISGIKDEAKNEADSITFFLANDTGVTNSTLNTQDVAKDELDVAAGKVADYYAEGIVLARTTNTATNEIAADTALSDAIGNDSISVTNVAENSEDNTKWDFTLTHSGVTKIVTIAKEKITYTTTALDDAKNAVEAYTTDSALAVNVASGADEDVRTVAVKTALDGALTNVDVTTVIKNDDGSYTVTLTDKTATDVTVTATLAAGGVTITETV